MANITTRKREYDANKDATEVKRKVDEAERRQAKNNSNILNHISGDDEKVQASLISKIIDKKGFEFADEVNRRSKALQENKKFSPEQTAALVTDWGNDNKVTKNIALFALKINLVFFSLWSLISLPCFPINSHREHCTRGIIFVSGRVIPFFAKRTGDSRGR